MKGTRGFRPELLQKFVPVHLSKPPRPSPAMSMLAGRVMTVPFIRSRYHPGPSWPLLGGISFPSLLPCGGKHKPKLGTVFWNQSAFEKAENRDQAGGQLLFSLAIQIQIGFPHHITCRPFSLFFHLFSCTRSKQHSLRFLHFSNYLSNLHPASQFCRRTTF